MVARCHTQPSAMAVELEYSIDFERREFSGLYTAATEEEFTNASSFIVIRKDAVTAPTKLVAELQWKIRVGVDVKFLGAGKYVFDWHSREVCLVHGNLRANLMPMPDKSTWTCWSPTGEDGGWQLLIA